MGMPNHLAKRLTAEPPQAPKAPKAPKHAKCVNRTSSERSPLVVSRLGVKSRSIPFGCRPAVVAADLLRCETSTEVECPI